MPLLLPSPELQFLDANGDPYAAGTLTMMVPGTDTPKDTWRDHAGTALNTNPVILDAAGRCLLFGSGEYRAVLRDVDGNLIFDQWTTSVVSDAMQPVVIAPTIAEAQRLLGIGDLAGEIARAEAAEAALGSRIDAETAARIAADNAEIARAEAAEAALQTALNNEIARAEAAESNLQSQITGAVTGGMRVGSGTTNATGFLTVTFTPPFTRKVMQWIALSNDAVIAGFAGIPGVTAPGYITVNGGSGLVVDVNTNPLANWTVDWWAIGE